MDQIYDGYVQRVDSFDPDNSPSKTREQVIYGILQNAPFNQLDGVWLRNVTKGGPMDEVRSLLFEVWMDEQGDGNPNQNHSNLYTQLLKNLDINLPRVDSYEYAFNEVFLDGAFVSPLFELGNFAIFRGIFSRDIGNDIISRMGSGFTENRYRYLEKV